MDGILTDLDLCIDRVTAYEAIQPAASSQSVSKRLHSWRENSGLLQGHSRTATLAWQTAVCDCLWNIGDVLDEYREMKSSATGVERELHLHIDTLDNISASMPIFNMPHEDRDWPPKLNVPQLQREVEVIRLLSKSNSIPSEVLLYRLARAMKTRSILRSPSANPNAIVDLIDGALLPSRFIAEQWQHSMADEDNMSDIEPSFDEVLRSMRPYCCTYTGCENQHRLFPTKIDWQEHESTSHRHRWKCPEDDGSYFSTVTDFEKHLRAHHTNVLGDSEIVMLLHFAIVGGPEDRTSCPICGIPSSDGNALVDHLDDHLIRLAILSFHTETAESFRETLQTRYAQVKVPLSVYDRQEYPPANPADQNPPCNTLHVANLPIDTSEEELNTLFSNQRGFKRLVFRTKQNGPLGFVEFEDVSFATKALNDLYGHLLHNSVKGGIRLSFSKNPLGVRSVQSDVADREANIPSASSVAPLGDMQRQWYKRQKVFVLPAKDDRADIWYIVIEEGSRDSLCLTMSTYGGRGVGREVSPEDHSAVYVNMRPPPPARLEGQLYYNMRLPIRIRHDGASTLRMSDAMRLSWTNFKRIDHREIVEYFGTVHADSLDTFKKNARAACDLYHEKHPLDPTYSDVPSLTVADTGSSLSSRYEVVESRTIPIHGLGNRQDFKKLNEH